MTIPIQNIYYLLCYAWDTLEEKETVRVDADDFDKAVDLFAKVLINGCAHLFKRGLDRNYITNSEEISGIRGKIEFNTTLKKNLLRKGKTHCQFDEFDHNVLHNQIIKTTIRTLLNVKSLDPALKPQLVTMFRRFESVDVIVLTKKDFSKVQLHRNNQFYKFLIHVCELIYDQILVDERTGEYVFRDFLRDDKKMAALFESFVRNFYKKEQSDYAVSIEMINWNATALGTSSIDLLPKMKTDISLESRQRKIIVDAKYYSETLSTHYDKAKIRSDNMYQIFAYVRNIESKGGANSNCEGVLLYPTVQSELSDSYQMENHKISFKTINLAQDWQGIHRDLLRMLDN